ncbi:hypothetical protein SPHINGO391_210014 [Sphingomonas aurantiaca]|jgi:hypothetical protein|uniref:Uncharacterized protein n=1 Tax=Sphingomonas aurantiaca TaxID=185949 RepID=A0A5E7XUX4_9SPHN|nr:hypothetical protein SPHINGO391_210014 [Sphingomonas aurantiaca]
MLGAARFRLASNVSVTIFRAGTAKEMESIVVQSVSLFAGRLRRLVAEATRKGVVGGNCLRPPVRRNRGGRRGIVAPCVAEAVIRRERTGHDAGSDWIRNSPA